MNFQFRPSTNKVIRLLEGPFYSQHDVDFYGDSSIVLFNNNGHTISQKNMNAHPKSIDILDAGTFNSNVVGYDFKRDAYFSVYDSAFKQNKIYSYTESLQEMMDDGSMFVEEQNRGFLWVIKNDEVIYKNVLKSQHEGYHHLPNWTRIINN